MRAKHLNNRNWVRACMCVCVCCLFENDRKFLSFLGWHLISDDAKQSCSSWYPHFSFVAALPSYSLSVSLSFFFHPKFHIKKHNSFCRYVVLSLLVRSPSIGWSSCSHSLFLHHVSVLSIATEIIVISCNFLITVQNEWMQTETITRTHTHKHLKIFKFGKFK